MILADNKINAGESRAVNVILDAMNAHNNSPGVCENGCRALNSIVSYGKKEKEKEKIKPNELINRKIVDGSQNIEGCLGAIDVVLDVMKAQIGNPDVCKNGCRTLGFIALKNGK